MATVQKVRAETPAQPGPSASDIRLAVLGINEEIRDCYIAGTFKDAQLAGTVTVTFTIETTGQVSRAVDAGSDLRDAEVVSCVLSAFSSLEFNPGGRMATEVTYPITFRNQG